MLETLRRGLAALFPLGAITGCTGAVDADADAGPRRFESCDELRSYVVDALVEDVVQARYHPRSDMDPDDDTEDESDEPGKPPHAPIFAPGPDEPDMAKHDGEHLYIAQNRRLYVVRASPVGDAALVGELHLGDDIALPTGLMVDGDHAVVVARSWEAIVEDRPATRVIRVDLTDPAAPTIIDRIDIDAYLSDARLVDGALQVVSWHAMALKRVADRLKWAPDVGLPAWPYPGPTEPERQALIYEARTIVRAHVRQLVATSELGDLLPLYRPTIGADPELLVACDQVYRPAAPLDLRLTTVARFDLETGDVSALGSLTGAGNVFASSDAVYTTSPARPHSLADVDQARDTHVQKITLGPDPALVASGRVPGEARPLWPMHASGDVLWLATADLRWGAADGSPVSSNVIALVDDGAGHLEVVGELRGVAPDAVTVRFADGVADLASATGRLFTVDLSDPTAPALAGEGPLPGFTSFLHPMADGHLLAVGRTGPLEPDALTLAVVDARDRSRPELAHDLATHALEWADPQWAHGFAYSADTLSIPVRTGTYDDPSRRTGVVVFDAAPDGLSELGRIDHDDLVERSACLFTVLYGHDAGYCATRDFTMHVRRSVHVGEHLFSISDYGVKVHALRDPDTLVADVLFAPLE